MKTTNTLYYHINTMMLLPLDHAIWLMADFKNWSNQEDELIKEFIQIAKKENKSAGIFVLRDCESNDKLFSDWAISQKAQQLGVDDVLFYINGFDGKNYDEKTIAENIKGVLSIDGFYLKDCYKNRLFNQNMLEKNFKYLKVLKNNEKNNFSEIAKLVQENKFDEFKKVTNIEYSIQGSVQEGNKLARTIGFPTANLNIANKIDLNFGVYDSKTYVSYLQKEYDSITCFIEKENGLHVLETHIKDLPEQDIVGWEIIVSIKKFIRKNEKFANLDAVKEQIIKDIKICDWKK